MSNPVVQSLLPALRQMVPVLCALAALSLLSRVAMYYGRMRRGLRKRG